MTPQFAVPPELTPPRAPAHVAPVIPLPVPARPNFAITRRPVDLTNVDARISDSFASVDWGDGVDYGPEFLVPDPALRNSAKAFVERLARVSVNRLGQPIPIPAFEPAADGSIDIHWGDGEERELLLGIRTTGNVASFFGRSSDGTNIKGVLHLDHSNEFLASWLLASA